MPFLYNNQYQTLTQLADTLGYSSPQSLSYRIKKYGFDKAIKMPVRKYQKIEYNGKAQTTSVWAKELGITYETLSKRIKERGVHATLSKPPKPEPHFQHGMSKHKLYKIWSAMKDRCSNPRHPQYKDYGARNITVCQRWKDSFAAFFADMGDRPAPNLTLDRLDNDGNYEPGNCAWRTRSANQNNMRSNRRVTHDGLTLTVTQWANRCGLSPSTLHYRLSLGWPFPKAISEPVKTRRRSK